MGSDLVEQKYEANDEPARIKFYPPQCQRFNAIPAIKGA
jgi:hypothetical protein